LAAQQLYLALILYLTHLQHLVVGLVQLQVARVLALAVQAAVLHTIELQGELQPKAILAGRQVMVLQVEM
jgi:hypothetical protein